jgi:aspartate/glutamate racemase
MHIGLIGGIGVAATVVYYQRLVAAVAAREGPKLELTIVHGDIQELIRNNLADRRDDQARAFLPLAERLKDAGCDCVALTSLRAHFCSKSWRPSLRCRLSPASLRSTPSSSNAALGGSGFSGREW